LALHKGIEFENNICNHLATNGWLYAEGDAKGYDTHLALCPADVLGRTEQNPWRQRRGHTA